MGITIGPADWWIATPESIDSLAISCPLGTILPDGSALISREGGCAWIVAPETTQVCEAWGNVTACGCIDNSPIGVSIHSDITSTNFPCLHSRLISCGFNPSDWFVPSVSQHSNPGYICRENWDSSSPTAIYWSSTEFTATCGIIFCYGSGSSLDSCKTNSFYVRAFRCVTY